MTNVTIASYASYTVSAPLTQGTNIEFLNDSGANGVVIFTRPGLGVETLANNGVTYTTAYFGGTITNFRPGAYPGILGDEVSIQVVTNLFGEMDLTGTDGVTFDNFMTFAAESAVEMSLVNGTIELSATAPHGDTLTGNEQTIMTDMMLGLFGTAAETATLVLTPTLRDNPNAPNAPFIDLVVTTDSAINPCFVEGTRILTTKGEVAVEALSIGDVVITPEGEELAIGWIGRREVDVGRALKPELVRPVVIEAGALGEGTPVRDLWLSPDHALLIEGVLVQARDLVNWANIRQAQGGGRVVYYHVELSEHAAMFAEGAAVESFLDTGHKALFDNEPGQVMAPVALMLSARAQNSFAPLVTEGAKLADIRRKIAARQVGIRLG